MYFDAGAPATRPLRQAQPVHPRYAPPPHAAPATTSRPHGYNAIAGAPPPSSTTTLLPLRHYGRARDIGVALTAPVVEYQRPQWTTALGESLWTPTINQQHLTHPSDAVTGPPPGRTAVGADLGQHAYDTPPVGIAGAAAGSTSPYASLLEASYEAVPHLQTSARPPFASVYDTPGGQPRRGGARGDLGDRSRAGTATGRSRTGHSPPPPPVQPSRVAPSTRRSRGIAEVRPGCTTSTERVRYRNAVTKKLIDLYDEVAELFECRENVTYQVTQAMRTDPRYSKERHGEVRLAYKPTPAQQSAVEAVESGLAALHDAVHELVACYLTPEEKRYLGIDTHFFQTSTEKASTYQYAPPSTAAAASGGGGGGRSKNSATTAATTPNPSLQHSEVREESPDGAGTPHPASSAPAHRAARTPTPPPSATTHAERRASQPLHSPPPPSPPAPQPPYAWGGTPSYTPASPMSPGRPAVPSAADRSPVDAPAVPEPYAATAALFASSPPPLSAPYASSIDHASRRWGLDDSRDGDDGEGGAAGAAAAGAATSAGTAAAEMAEGTPERQYAPAASASTLGGAWPSDKAGSPVSAAASARVAAGVSMNGGSAPVPPAQQLRLVKMPVRGPDGQILITKMPPTVPTGTKWVKVAAGTSGVPAPPRTPLASSTSAAAATASAPAPPSHPPSRTASALQRAQNGPGEGGSSATGRSAAAPPVPATRAEFKRFLIDSDSDSSAV